MYLQFGFYGGDPSIFPSQYPVTGLNPVQQQDSTNDGQGKLENLSPHGTVKLTTAKQTNTETKELGHSKVIMRSGQQGISGGSKGVVRRSQTFTPTAVTKEEEDFKQHSVGSTSANFT